MRAFEIISETQKKSSAVKLQSAWEKQQAKSTASRKRGEEYMAKIKQDVTDKSKKEQGVAEGWKDVVAGGAMALGALGAGAQTMPNVNAQQVELTNKYYNVLIQRAKEDGRELDTRTLNVLKAKAQDAAAKKTQQSSQQQGFSSQGSERKVAKDAGQFESQGVAEDWQKVNRHDKTDGLSKKAVGAYRREHPGSKLKTAVTTKPSKLKKGSKSAKRRASFCARMSGMKKHRTGAKTKRDPDSNINKALRRWHCESIEEMQELIMIGEQYISKLKEDGSAGGTSSGSIASVSMPLGGKKKKKGGGVNLLGGPVFKR